MKTRGQTLEDLLTTAFHSLQGAEQLTEEKVDIPFLLNIVGSYITAKEQGKLEEDTVPPSVLFEERIMPIVDESTLVQEKIEDE